ncbi:hypothetical protein IMZ48_14395 [Candidatus Bathyarchaeota archaeon]|nr:hypothetical protein [Candidatus Bathyarchaeota archaeon]
MLNKKREPPGATYVDFRNADLAVVRGNRRLANMVNLWRSRPDLVLL